MVLLSGLTDSCTLAVDNELNCYSIDLKKVLEKHNIDDEWYVNVNGNKIKKSKIINVLKGCLSIN